MIDTIYIFQEIHSKTDFFDLKERISNATKDLPRGNLHKDKKDKNVYITYGLASLGFEELKLRYVNEKKFKYYGVEILLRPKLLVEKGNYVDVLHVNEVPKVRERFNIIIGEVLGLKLPDLIYWRVKRIDYAIDLFINEDTIPTYLLLFKSGNLPRSMLEHPITIKYFNEKNSFYLCSESLTLNIYARYMTLLQKELEYKKSFANIEAAKNVLRVEIQYHIDSNRLKRQNKISENELRYFLNFDLCQRIIKYHFNAIIGKGNYYSLEKAYLVVEEKASSLREALQLRRVLKLVHQKGSIWAAKHSYTENKEDKKKALKEYSRIINRLRDFNVNAVTISYSLDINELKGLSDIIDEYFTEIRDTKLGR